MANKIYNCRNQFGQISMQLEIDYLNRKYDLRHGSKCQEIRGEKMDSSKIKKVAIYLFDGGFVGNLVKVKEITKEEKDRGIEIGQYLYSLDEVGNDHKYINVLVPGFSKPYGILRELLEIHY